MHLGRDDPATERANEAALLACLRAHEGRVDRLYLVGDVFDQYIAYRHLVPKGFVRFLGLLAAWADDGVPVTYLVGNHDPWHDDYFPQELGVRVVFDALHEPLFGRNVYMAHGDGLASDTRRYNRLKPLLRHPIPVALYRALLPGDLGFGFARWYKERFGHHGVVPASVDGLRRHARRLLQETDTDIVVMGHCHQAELSRWAEGCYLNTGSWHDQRTFGRLDEAGPQLLYWNGSCARPWSPEAP